jgi:hypothetical protein
MEKKIEEFYEVIANRVPPGDRWTSSWDKTIYSSITEALEAWFKENR